jgi:hypothetical protein
MGESFSQGAGSFSRRGLLRGGLLVGLGAVGLTMAPSGIAYATTGAAAILNGSLTVNFIFQVDWRYCGACRNLYYAGHSGICVGTDYGLHDAGSSTGYGVPDQTPSPNIGGPFIQSPWRICANCACLFWPEANDYCAAGGGNKLAHNSSGSGPYFMMNNAGAISDGWTGFNPTPAVQPGWRYCGNCKVLYWGSAWSASICQYAIINGSNVNNGNNGFGHASGNTVYYLFMGV